MKDLTFDDYSYTETSDLPPRFVFDLNVKSGVEEKGLFDKSSFIEPPDEQVLGPLNAIQVEVPQMDGGQHKTEPPSHCQT